MTEQHRSFRSQNLILENRNRLSVSGVDEVNGFDDSYIRMKTSLGDLVVYGDDLHMEILSVETGEAVVTGEISDLIYEQSHREGLLSRLLKRNENRDR